MGGAAHGGANLLWPGTMDGFPVIGQPGVVPNLKQEELERAEERRDYKSRMFLLWEAEEKQAFDELLDRIINGWYRLLRRADTWDEEHKHYRVWIEWYQVYGVIPVGK